MNKALVELIAQFAIFLDMADESEISLDAAVRLQEEMAFRLQKLSASERQDFVEVLNEVAENEGFSEHKDVLARLPEETGLLEEKLEG